MERTEYTFNVLRFSGWFVGVSVVIPIILFLVELLIDVDLGSSGTSIIPILIAAMQEGIHFARSERAAPKGRPAWKISITMALIAFVWSIILAFALWIFEPSAIEFVLQILTPIILIAIFVGIFVLYLLLGRFFFGMGARNELKVIARKAARESK